MIIDPTILMGLQTIGTSLGLNVAGNALYDAIKTAMARGRDSKEAIARELAITVPSMTVERANVFAEKAITFLAENGYIDIRGSKVFAAERLTTGSREGGRTRVGDDTTLETKNTRIDFVGKAFAETQGDAEIEQDKDGNIIFRVGRRRPPL